MSGLPEEEWEAARALLKALAHDLNNLLSPLYLYGEILEESLADPVLKQKAASILHRSEAMRKLVEDSRWLYRSDEDAELRKPGLFCGQMAALTGHFFSGGSVKACWAAPKGGGEVPANVIARRLLLVSRVQRLASELEQGATVLLLFGFRDVPATLRAYSGHAAAEAIKKFGFGPDKAVFLDDAASSALLASLSLAQPKDIGV